jgi:hypothetical protein
MLHAVLDDFFHRYFSPSGSIDDPSDSSVVTRDLQRAGLTLGQNQPYFRVDREPILGWSSKAMRATSLSPQP